MEHHLCVCCGKITRFVVEVMRGVRVYTCCECGYQYPEPAQERKIKERHDPSEDKWR